MSLVSPPEPTPNLTSGRVLARNTVWNLAGQLLPMAVAVVAIPPLVRGLGVDRFGLLSLAWIVIGYFSLFDLGIGRALTKLLADRLARNEDHEVAPLIWTSLLLLFLLGALGGLVTFAVSPWLVHSALKVPAALQPETLRGFYWLALSIPTVTVTAGLRGALEAQQRFRILSLIRIPTSIFSFAGPLLVLPFSRSLVSVIGILVVGRVIGLLAHLFACFHAMPLLRHGFVLQRSVMFPVIKLGGWMTVSNIISPVMVYLDRFLIGALLSVSAVAYYTAPLDMVSRVTVIPGAMASVLFPAFAVSLMQDPGRTKLLLARGLKYTVLVIYPIILVIFIMAPEILRFWLGPAFAQSGSSVLRWLSVGVFVNCLALGPFALLQSAGRPDITAKLHLLELPLYLGAVWVLTKSWGIEGTAIAWTARVTVDAVLLLVFSLRLLPRKPSFLPRLAVTVLAGLLVLYGATFLPTLAIKAAFALPALLAFGLAGWFWGLAPEERAFTLLVKGSVPAKQEAVPDVY